MIGPSVTSLRIALLALAVGLGGAAAGCKQGSGDRCEIMSDCDDGLYCDLAAGDNSGGVCRPSSVAVDSGAGPTDAAHDASAMEAVEGPGDAAGEGAPDAPADTPPDVSTETGVDAPASDAAGAGG